MKSFIASLLLHISLVISISSSIAGNSQPNYEVYFQTTEKTNSSAQAIKKNKSQIKNTLSESVKADSATAPKLTENSVASDGTEGVISLNGQAGPTQSIFSYLITQIYKNRIYPHESVRLKQEGQVTVRFYIDAQGEITDIQVAAPSNHKLLNQAAVKTLNQIKINTALPEVEQLYNRSYSFTFDFEITKTST